MRRRAFRWCGGSRTAWWRGTAAQARLAAVVVLGAAGIGLAGCTSARNDLGTGSSACYLALPAASAAVHHHGKLRGVRLVAVSTLASRAPTLYNAARAAGQHNVCLVAFAGTYASAGITEPLGQTTTGDLAVVELGYPDHRLIGTVLGTRQPLPFGHSFAFPL